MSALDLARCRFASTISAQIIFPAFSIGRASYLAVLEASWLKTGDDLYLWCASEARITLEEGCTQRVVD